MKSWAFAFRGEGSETLEIDIYDVVGESWWNPDAVSAKKVRQLLKANKSATLIKLRVNSAGGDVIDGFAIYNLLNEHPARVEADVDALAASMASVIIMAADEVRVASNALVMIHNPWGGVLGEADDLRSYADLLDKMRDNIATVYVDRTGIDRDEVLALMDAETWLSADEAKERGFADKVKGAKAKMAASALKAVSFSNFANVPEEVQRAIEAAQGSQTPHAKPTNQLELPAVAQATPPAPGGQADSTKNPTGVEVQMQNAIKLLALKEDADEEAVLAAIKKLQVSARAGDEIEKLVGATGDAAIGAVRALKAGQEQHAELSAEVAKVKVQLARRDFEAALKSGNDDRKISPAQQKHYLDRFEAAVKNGDDGASVAQDLVGFLAATPKNAALGSSFQAKIGGPETTGATGELKWNGKTYAELTFSQRAQLANENNELWRQMKADHEAA